MTSKWRSACLGTKILLLGVWISSCGLAATTEIGQPTATDKVALATLSSLAAERTTTADSVISSSPTGTTSLPTQDTQLSQSELWSRLFGRHQSVCDRFCVLGIVPGRSSAEDVASLHLEVGGNFQSSDDEPIILYGSGDYVSFELGVYIGGSQSAGPVVTGLVMWAVDLDRYPDLRNALEAITFQQLLRRYGEPDDIYVVLTLPVDDPQGNVTFSFYMFYDDEDFIAYQSSRAAYLDSGTQIRACISSDYLSRMTIYAGGSDAGMTSLDVLLDNVPLPYMEVFPLDSSTRGPVAKITGLNVSQFSAIALSPDTSRQCLDFPAP